MIFSSSVAYSKAYSNDNIRLKFLFGSYIPRCRLESVITSTGFTPVWGLTATHTPQNIRFIRAGSMPTHNTHYEDNYANNCNSMFSNRDGDKEAKLTDFSFKYDTNLSICLSIHLHIYLSTLLPKVLGHPLLMKGLTTLVISMSTNLNV